MPAPRKGPPGTRLLPISLKGRTLQFPDGNPFCLGCGAPPTTRRAVTFTGLLDLSNPEPMSEGAEVVNGKLDFDAPLCGSCRKRALLTGLGAVGLLLLAVVFAGLAIALKAPAWLAAIAGGVPAIPGLALWYFKDKAGLECSAGVGPGEDELGLWFPNGVPRRRT